MDKFREYIDERTFVNFNSRRSKEIRLRQFNQFVNFNSRVRRYLRKYEEAKSSGANVSPIAFEFYTNTHCIGRWLRLSFDSYDELVKYFLKEKYNTYGTFGDVSLSVYLYAGSDDPFDDRRGSVRETIISAYIF